MDLNLYLGLPHSPIRRGSDLGSDLALGSISILSEETHNSSTSMSGFIEPTVDSHAPYSPTHASFTPDEVSVEPLDRTGIQIPGVEYRLYHPPTSYGSLPPLSRDEPNSSSHVEYCPCAVTYIPNLSVTQETRAEPLHLEANNPVEHIPYSPSYAAPVSTTGEEDSVHIGGNGHVEHVLDSVTAAAPGQPIESLDPEEVNFHTPYSPSYTPVELVHDGRSNDNNLQPARAVNPYETSIQTSDPLAQEGPSQQRSLHYPEVRFQRLIDSNRHLLRTRRFRSTAPYRVAPNLGASSLGMEHILQEIVSSERSVETSGSQKVSAVSLVAGDAEEEKTDQDRAAANFECNICLDIAKEPVVTSCGHLFCWSCLYQWLHVHSDHKECPVCKGEVTESNITPIYGRGSSETGVEKTIGEVGDSGVKIPPRPRGHRFESLRQQIRRPSSRRLGHEISSWRRIVDEEIRNGYRVEGQDMALQRIFDGAPRRVLARLRDAQRLRREGSSDNGLNLGATRLARNNTEGASNSQNSNSPNDVGPRGSRTSSFVPEGIDFWHRVALISLPTTEGIAALTGVMERMASVTNHSGAPASVNPENPEPLQETRGATPGADQASASSTMAVIQGDVEVLNMPGEASAAGSSRSLRRRRRNGGSSSLDVDGGVHHAQQRRRLN